MPEIEIGPFNAASGPEVAKETTRFLRIAFFSGNSVLLPDYAVTREDLLPYVGELLTAQERRIAGLLLAFKQGDIGFVEDADGRVLQLNFRYPEYQTPNDKVRPS